jgi:hypothetical protein
MRSQAFVKLYERPLRKLFFLTYKEAPPEYRRWSNIINTDKAFEDDFKVSEFSTVPLKSEGADTQFDTVIPGDIKRWTSDEYGLGYIVTRRMRDDDKTSTVMSMTKALRRSFRHLFEVVAAEPLNNATSTSAKYLGMDGVALASASHPLLDGTTTVSNTASADFGQTSYENAYINFFRTKGEQNLPIHVTPRILWGDGGQMFEFAKYTKQDWEVDSADRNKNYLNRDVGAGVVKDYVPSRYATDTDAWALLSAKGKHTVSIVIHTNPEFEMGSDFSSGNVMGKGYARVGMGHSDWRGVYYSAGAS